MGKWTGSISIACIFIKDWAAHSPWSGLHSPTAALLSSYHSSIHSLLSSTHWPASLSACAPSYSESGSHFPALSPQISTDLALFIWSLFKCHLVGDTLPNFLIWESNTCPSLYFSLRHFALTFYIFTCLLLSVPFSLEWPLHEGRNSISFIYWCIPKNRNNVCDIVYTL